MLSSLLLLTLVAVLGVSATQALRARAISTPPAASCSSSDRASNLSSIDAPVSGAGNAGGISTWKLTVDDTSAGYKQQVTGFGACVTDATVSVFEELSADDQSKLLADLMTSSGADFSLMRHTVGGSDLTGDPAYTYDDTSGTNGPALTGFNLGTRGTAMASLLASMRKAKFGLTIVGSSWSAPGWMKLNGVLVGNTTNNNLNPNSRVALAEYFVAYLQAFSAAGAAVNAITIQNEPLNSQAGYPTMYVYADESAYIINQTIGPALRAQGLDTQIWAYDHNTDVPSYPQSVITAASPYVPAVAWHCYAPNNDWTVLTDFHTTNPDTLQYMTECWTSPLTGWSQAADFAMGSLQNWASGAMAWTLGSDTTYGPHLSSGGCDTCRGLFVVDVAAKTYEFSVDYYMLAQFSKFIPSGAKVLNGSGSSTNHDGTGLQSVATRNPDGSLTVVMINKSANDIYVSVTMLSGDEWSGRVYANSVVTWLLPAAS